MQRGSSLRRIDAWGYKATGRARIFLFSEDGLKRFFAGLSRDCLSSSLLMRLTLEATIPCL